MKFLATVTVLLFTYEAWAQTGVAFIRTDTEEELEAKIYETVDLINRGRYRSPHFRCNGKAKPYAIEVDGLRHQMSRNGEIEFFYSAIVKYRCKQ